MIEVSLLLSLLAHSYAPVQDFSASPSVGRSAAVAVHNGYQEDFTALSMEELIAEGKRLSQAGHVLIPSFRHAVRDAVAREISEDPMRARALPARIRNLPASFQLVVLEGLERAVVPEALTAMARMVRDYPSLNVFVLESLARSAAEVGGPFDVTVLDAVRFALLNGDTTVQRLAAKAAGVLRDDEAVPELIAMLGSQDALVVAAAHGALVQHTGIGYSASPSLWERWYEEESHFLKERFDDQVRALWSRNAVQRVQAAKAIAGGRLGRGHRAQALIDFFPVVEDESQQLQVLSALRTLDSRSAIPLLNEVASKHRSARVRAAASRALESLNRNVGS